MTRYIIYSLDIMCVSVCACVSVRMQCWFQLFSMNVFPLQYNSQFQETFCVAPNNASNPLSSLIVAWLQWTIFAMMKCDVIIDKMAMLL